MFCLPRMHLVPPAIEFRHCIQRGVTFSGTPRRLIRSPLKQSNTPVWKYGTCLISEWQTCETAANNLQTMDRILFVWIQLWHIVSVCYIITTFFQQLTMAQTVVIWAAALTLTASSESEAKPSTTCQTDEPTSLPEEKLLDDAADADVPAQPRSQHLTVCHHYICFIS